jgi:hypothetical protein
MILPQFLSHTWESGNVANRRKGQQQWCDNRTNTTLEAMEPRRLLSAAIEHGVLSIEGTHRSDTIVLTMDSPKTLRIRVGNVESTFLKKSFSKIRINAGPGEDLITIGSDAAPVSCPTSVSGGAGADTIVGGAGNDLLSGGDGADLITGAGGNDKIDGDNGADDLHGGDGRDSLRGGRGDDQLHDDAGRDSVYGNAGSDRIYFHDDVKQFRDQAKRENKFAEPVFSIPANSQHQLVMNHVPLDLAGGGHVPGGLIVAGGSTLIAAGTVLQQWNGVGLGSTNFSVPHFDLPGNTIVGGSMVVNSGSVGTLIGGSAFRVTGGSILTFTNPGTYTGGLTISSGLLGANTGATIPINGTPIQNGATLTRDTPNSGDATSSDQTTGDDGSVTGEENTVSDNGDADTSQSAPGPNTGTSINPASEDQNTADDYSGDSADDSNTPNVLL